MAFPRGVKSQRNNGVAPGRTPASLPLADSQLPSGEACGSLCTLQSKSTQFCTLSLILFDSVGFSKLPFLLRSLPVCSCC